MRKNREQILELLHANDTRRITAATLREFASSIGAVGGLRCAGNASSQAFPPAGAVIAACWQSSLPGGFASSPAAGEVRVAGGGLCLAVGSLVVEGFNLEWTVSLAVNGQVVAPLGSLRGEGALPIVFPLEMADGARVQLVGARRVAGPALNVLVRDGIFAVIGIL